MSEIVDKAQKLAVALDDLHLDEVAVLARFLVEYAADIETMYRTSHLTRWADDAGELATELRRRFAAVDTETVARRFHEAYERLAPEYGYVTRPETAVSFDALPVENKKLMYAVAAEVVAAQ